MAANDAKVSEKIMVKCVLYFRNVATDRVETYQIELQDDGRLIDRLAERAMVTWGGLDHYRAWRFMFACLIDQADKPLIEAAGLMRFAQEALSDAGVAA